VLFNPSFTYWVQNVPRGTKCTQAWNFLEHFSLVQTILPIFLFVHFSPTDTTQSSFATYIVLTCCMFYQTQLDQTVPILVKNVFYVLSNPIGPNCTHFSKKSLKNLFCQNLLHKSSNNTHELQEGHHKQPYCTAD
jgi:hypothetical protein